MKNSSNVTCVFSGHRTPATERESFPRPGELSHRFLSLDRLPRFHPSCVLCQDLSERVPLVGRCFSLHCFLWDTVILSVTTLFFIYTSLGAWNCELEAGFLIMTTSKNNSLCLVEFKELSKHFTSLVSLFLPRHKMSAGHLN